MTADKLTVSQSDGSAQFEGNVIIAQGVIRLAASLVTVTYLEAGGIDRLNASGGVTLVTQTESAKAETAEYDLTNRQLVMRGEVVLIQGQNAISADSMNIDLASGAAVMEGRVRTVLSSEIKVMTDLPFEVAEGQGGLKIESLRKSYRKRLVIRDVSMQLHRGEVVALLGPNGSGKTTCFYSIAGLVTPEGGKVSIDGRDVTRMPMYRRARLGIGYLPQEMSIFRGMTVENNILAVLELSEADRKRQYERLEELLNEFSIDHLRRAPALALSGGERRRVEIARCLATNPKYLLLDEPFAGVDPIAVSEIRTLVSALKKRGLGVLITDHNVRETLEIVDRAYILHDGKVLMSGTTQEIVEDENVKRVYLGENFRLG